MPIEINFGQLLTTDTRILKQLEDQLPVYHTRKMRQDLAHSMSVINWNQNPKAHRNIYSELTSDASTDQNPDIDERARQANLAEDPEFITLLRVLNKGRPNYTFSMFFQKLEEKVEAMTAADEKASWAHLSTFLSIRDLIDQVTFECPEGTPIPSEATVLFAFVPKNAYSNTAKLYKSKIELQFKVQTRQLRTSHIDEHYCVAFVSDGKSKQWKI